jgi:hypothetical protein
MQEAMGRRFGKKLDSNSPVGAANVQEGHFIRLLRLLGAGVHECTTSELLEQLCSMYSIDPDIDLGSPEERAKLLKKEARLGINQRLMSSLPCDWPERMGDWDDLGDCGAVFDQYFGDEASDWLFEADSDAFVDRLLEMYRAESMAVHNTMYEVMEEEHISVLMTEGYSREDAATEFEKLFRENLRRFVETWKNRIVTLLERRIELPKLA